MSVFRHARSRNVYPPVKRPRPLTDAERYGREHDLILLLATMKEEAWTLGLMYTFRGLDRAERAIGWEIAASRTVRNQPSTRNSRFVKDQIRAASDAVHKGSDR